LAARTKSATSGFASPTLVTTTTSLAGTSSIGTQAVAVVPVGDRRSSLRADLASVPIDDVPASEVVVVTRVGDENPLVADFILAARANLVPVAA